MALGPSPRRGTRLGALLRRIGRLLTRQRHIDAAADARRWMEIDRLG